MTVDEILEATGGVLVTGPAARAFSRLHTDSREVTAGGLFWALRGETQDGHAYIGQALERGAGGIVCQVPPASTVSGATVIRVPDTLQALFAMTRWKLDRLRVPIVAITGSSGKTTTKELVAHVLARRLRVHKSAGNLNTYTGVPMTVFEMDAADSVLVMEYAMSRAGEIAELTAIAPPQVAVVLNVGLAHVGLLGSIEAVAAAKRELVEGLAPGGVAVLNADDPRVDAMAPAAGRVVRYGRASQADVRAEDVVLRGLEGSSFRLVTRSGEAEVALTIPGAHSVSNALAAAAVALEFGFDPREVAAALRGFKPPERRLRIVSGKAGSTIIDDCYNANPSSMRAALEVLRMAPTGATRIAVLGDMLELGDHAQAAHEELGALAARSTDRLIAIGTQAAVVVEAAHRAGLRGADAVVARDLADAVLQIEPALHRGAYVLVKGSRGMRMEGIVAALSEPA
ncbi:MAG TPA: UDP-N-acetylmuramoyl-tripeptide--D-alanyl-D-alanine ligase [Candidatus Limnocylindrales bacterium]|nr:UDP-N-acetylmuramoyl-tripeptide--D-alanyl-D-alanine ligase [Candidatus Limnocylindrales bacterium]